MSKYQGMKALVIGATGATGKDLIDVLLNDVAYTEVVAFVRRPSGKVHPKLTEVKTNFEKLEEVSGLIEGDVWFSCLGTTKTAAGSEEKQWKIDYDIPAQFAAIARKNEVNATVLLSAYGASSYSAVFYSRLKGELENHIDGLNFPRFIIFRPGLLLRNKTDRLGERIMSGILNALGFIGIAKKFKPLPTRILSEKMAKAPKVLSQGKHIIPLNEIFSF